MSYKKIGFLHPGAMGISLAATAQNSGHKAYWVSHGRSQSTSNRAEKQKLIEVPTINELCECCSIVVSVCPPHAARDVAESVIACTFKGIYVDVNAISPQQVQGIGKSMDLASIAFVDGGIIGPPAWKPESTWLYLSGPAAHTVADCFKAGPLAVDLIGEEIGKASALKMCYAANTKGTTALLCAIVAAAQKMGVREELEKQWSQQNSDYVRNTHARMSGVTAKAWRFTGEMEEIAATFEQAGLPGEFHRAAADIYQRIAKFKDADPSPSVEDVIDALLEQR